MADSRIVAPSKLLQALDQRGQAPSEQAVSSEAGKLRRASSTGGQRSKNASRRSSIEAPGHMTSPARSDQSTPASSGLSLNAVKRIPSMKQLEDASVSCIPSASACVICGAAECCCAARQASEPGAEPCTLSRRGSLRVSFAGDVTGELTTTKTLTATTDSEDTSPIGSPSSLAGSPLGLSPDNTRRPPLNSRRRGQSFQHPETSISLRRKAAATVRRVQSLYDASTRNQRPRASNLNQDYTDVGPASQLHLRHIPGPYGNPQSQLQSQLQLHSQGSSGPRSPQRSKGSDGSAPSCLSIQTTDSSASYDSPIKGVQTGQCVASAHQGVHKEGASNAHALRRAAGGLLAAANDSASWESPSSPFSRHWSQSKAAAHSRDAVDSPTHAQTPRLSAKLALETTHNHPQLNGVSPQLSPQASHISPRGSHLSPPGSHLSPMRSHGHTPALHTSASQPLHAGHGLSSQKHQQGLQSHGSGTQLVTRVSDSSGHGERLSPAATIKRRHSNLLTLDHAIPEDEAFVTGQVLMQAVSSARSSMLHNTAAAAAWDSNASSCGADAAADTATAATTTLASRLSHGSNWASPPPSQRSLAASPVPSQILLPPPPPQSLQQLSASQQLQQLQSPQWPQPLQSAVNSSAANGDLLDSQIMGLLDSTANNTKSNANKGILITSVRSSLAGPPSQQQVALPSLSGLATARMQQGDSSGAASSNWPSTCGFTPAGASVISAAPGYESSAGFSYHRGVSDLSASEVKVPTSAHMQSAMASVQHTAGGGHTHRLARSGQQQDNDELAIEESIILNRRLLDARRTLLDEVKIDSVIGFGSMGVIYFGTLWSQRVVVKLIEHNKGMMGKEQKRAKLARVEAIVSRMLLHPNIVLTYGSCTGPLDVSKLQLESVGSKRPLGSLRVGRNPSTRQRIMTMMVQEYCDRGTLRDALKQQTLSQFVPQQDYPRFVLQLALDIAEGLRYMHSLRILHLDLKAENVLLQTTQSGDRSRLGGVVAKVADFGIALVLPPDSDFRQDGVHGTVSHMPPEAMRDPVFSFATDVYSFGVVLWELVTRGTVFKGLAAHQVVESVCDKGLRPPWPSDLPTHFTPLQSLAQQCWDANPVLRPTFPDIVTKLTSLLHPTTKRPPTKNASNITQTTEESDELEAALKEQRRQAARTIEAAMASSSGHSGQSARSIGTHTTNNNSNTHSTVHNNTAGQSTSGSARATAAAAAVESIDAARASSYDVPERASEAGSARSGRAASAAESGAREKITLAGILDGPPPKDVLGRMLYYLAQMPPPASRLKRVDVAPGITRAVMPMIEIHRTKSFAMLGGMGLGNAATQQDQQQ